MSTKEDDNMSNVPFARQLLAGVAEKLRELEHGDIADRIEEISSRYLVRRSPEFRADPYSPQLDAEARKRIHELRDEGLATMKIAEILGVNVGRVSEVLATR